MTLPELIPALQLAVGPVILISGVGLILLSITNRFARVIDRARQLSDLLATISGDRAARTFEQLQILRKRARIIRAAAAFGVLSAGFAALMMIVLFVALLLELSFAAEILLCFISCMVSLIVCLMLFLYDINLSLNALWLELAPLQYRATQSRAAFEDRPDGASKAAGTSDPNS